MSAARVLLTRPVVESETVARKLEALGLQPVIVPVIAIELLPAAIPAAAADAVLVTSIHATAALAATDLERLRQRPLLAVGTASAAAARAAGFSDVRIANGDADALRDLVRLTLPSRSHLLYLAGRVRKAALTSALTADGHRVSVVETYDTPAVAWSEAAITILRADPPVACLHYSRRSAELCVGEIVRGGLDAVAALAFHLCLSPDVAAPLHEAGFARVVVAGQPTSTSLLQALSARVAKRAEQSV